MRKLIYVSSLALLMAVSLSTMAYARGDGNPHFMPGGGYGPQGGMLERFGTQGYESSQGRNSHGFNTSEEARENGGLQGNRPDPDDFRQQNHNPFQAWGNQQNGPDPDDSRGFKGGRGHQFRHGGGGKHDRW